MFELECAQRRLEAVERARELLEEAAQTIEDADVRNARVAKALAMCRRELADYRHVTTYAIRKREKRANNQPTRQKWS